METITKKEWQDVLYVMNLNNRTSGFVDVVDGVLTFFDADPFIDNVHAVPIEKDLVLKYIDMYED